MSLCNLSAHGKIPFRKSEQEESKHDFMLSADSPPPELPPRSPTSTDAPPTLPQITPISQFNNRPQSGTQAPTEQGGDFELTKFKIVRFNCSVSIDLNSLPKRLNYDVKNKMNGPSFSPFKLFLVAGSDIEMKNFTNPGSA